MITPALNLRKGGALPRLILALLLSSAMSFGYTVLTHEAIIDALWENSIRKLLLSRFPDATPDQLVEAHAHAYGGCIIQDLGYYPFSNKLFSDLTHYVRSGDFVVALLRDSRDLNEFAFALGALEHYLADIQGHRMATNLAVPIMYPKLKRKFGRNYVTYWDDPLSHIRTEFAFDVIQVGQGHYPPNSYRKFIGFKVSKDLLERAFLETYGLELKDMFGSVDLALGTYRFFVKSTIPTMTKVAWNLKKDQLRRDTPGLTRRKFLYNLSRTDYEKEWGKDYTKPGIGTRIITFLVRWLPRAGPFSSLKIPAPTAEVEKLFMASFNATVENYQSTLSKLDTGLPKLANENCDAHLPTVAGSYKGADAAYAKLLEKHAERRFSGVKPDLRANILTFYRSGVIRDFSAESTKKEKEQQAKLQENLQQLKSSPEAADVTSRQD